MRVPFWVVLVIALALLGAGILTKTIPYPVVLPILVGWLAGRFAVAPVVAPKTKQIVVIATVWATAMSSALGPAAVFCQLALVAIGAYIVLYHDLTNTRT